MLRKDLIAPIIIFVLAFSLRLSFIIFWHPAALVADEVDYDRIASSLLNKKGYVNEFGQLTASRPPAYPIFLSGLYCIFGRNLFLVRIIQTIIGSFACLLIFYLAKDIFGNKTAFLAGLFSAVHLGFIAQSAKILTECLSIFILLCSVIFFHKLKKAQVCKKRYYACFGLMMGIASLVRSNLSILFFMLGIFLVCDLFQKQLAVKNVVHYIVICGIAFIVPIAPWAIRNYAVFHGFIPLSTFQGIALYTSYKPLDGKIYGFTPKDEITEKAKAIINEAERSSFLTKEAVEFVKTNPKVFFNLIGLKLAYFFSPFDWELIRDAVVYNYLYMFYFPFFILGIFLYLPKLNALTQLYLPILGVVLTSILFFGLPRFRLPIEPYMIILASATIVFLYDKVARKKFFVSCLSLFLIFNFAGFLNSNFIKQTLKSLLTVVGCW